jgi:Zn-dependent peptidase ImmA (M78 family)
MSHSERYCYNFIMEDFGFEPSVLKWAREKLNMSVEILATRLAEHWKDITPELITSWEKGIDKPHPTHIRKLAEIYKRPVAVFLLAHPPEENDLPPDRRTIGSREGPIFAPETILVIRKARRVQKLAEELEEELGATRSFKYQKHKITENPVLLAAKIRSDLGISIKDQMGFRRYPEFFEYLRSKIENTGVITLRSGGSNSFPVGDARAFSFTDTKPYVILINNKDKEGAKNFSLLHEFAHVLVREAGICNNFSSFNGKNGKVDMLEVFCNRFAASFLVPEDNFLAHRSLVGKSRILSEDLELVVKSLTRDFKVSRFVILRKLLTLNFISSATYKSKAEEWENETPPKRSGGRSDPPRTAILNNGFSFSSLVFEAYKNKKLSYAGVSDYLGMKAKHIPAFEKLLLHHHHGK